MREINVKQVEQEFSAIYNVDNELLLYDSTTGVPHLLETSRLNCLVLGICTKGNISYTDDTEQHTLGSGDVFILPKGQVLGDIKTACNAEMVVLVLSYNYLQEIVSGVSLLSTLFLFARQHPVFHLEDKQVKQLLSYVRILKLKIKDTTHHYRRDLIASILKVLIYDLLNIVYHMQQVETGGKNRAEVIFSDFITLVEKNFRKERRLGWYAEQLCITPKYLSETVKAASKRTPGSWIDYYVMREIRVLLKNSKKSIKQIAETLNFPNQSAFGKYFKEHYGESPSGYRKN